MAVCIASNLAKDIAGAPLLRGVSFKLEPRERMTIAGRNGAGKTTLLRMLAGEQSIDGGELSFAKGVRVALHDQRPPRDRGRAVEEYLLSGCALELAVEARLARLEQEMAAGASDEATLDALCRARRPSSSTTVGTSGAAAHGRSRAASASPTRTSRATSRRSPVES